MRTRVHINLHKTKEAGHIVYSLLQKGKVVDHATRFWLKDVVPVVRPGGLARARQEKSRNVHAFLEGVLVESSNADIDKLKQISYNYDVGHFFDKGTGEKYSGSKFVYFESR